MIVIDPWGVMIINAIRLVSVTINIDNYVHIGIFNKKGGLQDSYNKQKHNLG